MDVQHAKNGLHSGGFSRTIGTNDDGNFTWIYRNGTVMQNIGTPAISAGHRVADQKRFGHSAAPLFFNPVPR